MNPLHLVSNPSENKEDLEIKKAKVGIKNIKSPFKNEIIENQIQYSEESVQKQNTELEN